MPAKSFWRRSGFFVHLEGVESLQLHALAQVANAREAFLVQLKPRIFDRLIIVDAREYYLSPVIRRFATKSYYATVWEPCRAGRRVR